MSAVDASYGEPDALDATAQAAAYELATRDAMTDGFTGYRAVADVTPLVRSPAQRRVFGRYEQLVDRVMLRLPFSALCAYDVDLLENPDEPCLLACAHPLARAGFAPFGLSATPDGIALRGELDLVAHDELHRLLDGTAAAHHDGRLLVDVADTRFLDHRALLAFERHGTTHGVRVRLRMADPLVGRIADLLRLEAVDVEVRR